MRMNSRRQESFAEALRGKSIPILTLDNRWYMLLTSQARKQVSNLEYQLNTYLKRQGKLNTETKEIRKLKKKLMDEIMPLVDEAEQNPNPLLDKKIDQNRRLLEECNEKLERYQNELTVLPQRIEDVNIRLMQITMDCCYQTMKESTKEIQHISEWVKRTRIELKKKLIRKQELEQRNHAIYTYMHALFGAEVIDMFDMQYNPEDQHPAIPGEENKKTGEKSSETRSAGA